MATTKITSPELFELGSLNTALKLPSGTTAERPTSPSTGEWRYNTTTNLIEFYDGGAWRDLQSQDIPPIASEHFNTVTYSGTSATQSITGVGFKPDWVWIKRTDGSENHYVQDSSRGSTYQIYTNLTDAEFNETGAITSFDSDGWTMGSYNGINNSGEEYVAWCWKANGGTTSSNTDGTISSTVQVNTKGGFSIVQYTANGTGGATVGHGLNSAPELIILKNLDRAGYGWLVYHKDISPAAAIVLNTTGAKSTQTGYFNDTATTSTVFTLGSDTFGNYAGDDYIAYCFESKAEYSKFGSYTGNGSTNGPVINTGFEPAFLMIKRTDTALIVTGKQ